MTEGVFLVRRGWTYFGLGVVLTVLGLGWCVAKDSCLAVKEGRRFNRGLMESYKLYETEANNGRDVDDMIFDEDCVVCSDR